MNRCLCLAALIPLVTPELAQAETERPNILFIAVDDLRPELGCYGAAHIKTPHIDRLATHILSYEDEGEVIFFEGNFSAFEESKKERLGDITPKRPRFKSLL